MHVRLRTFVLVIWMGHTCVDVGCKRKRKKTCCLRMRLHSNHTRVQSGWEKEVPAEAIRSLLVQMRHFKRMVPVRRRRFQLH